MDEEKAGLKVEDGEEKNEEDNNNLEVLEEDVDGSNDDEEEDRPNKTKEEIPNNLRFFKGVMDIDNLLPQNINMETLQDSKITKVRSKKPVRKAIEILHKLAEKEEYKKEKDDNIDDKTKEVEINEVAEMDNNKLVFDSANDAPPTQDTMTNTTAAATEEARTTTTTWAPRKATPKMRRMIPRGGERGG